MPPEPAELVDTAMHLRRAADARARGHLALIAPRLEVPCVAPCSVRLVTRRAVAAPGPNISRFERPRAVRRFPARRNTLRPGVRRANVVYDCAGRPIVGQLVEVLRRRLPRPLPDVGRDLLGPGGAGDDAGDRRLGGQSADRELEDRDAAGCRRTPRAPRCGPSRRSPGGRACDGKASRARPVRPHPAGTCRSAGRRRAGSTAARRRRARGRPGSARPRQCGCRASTRSAP